MKNASLRKTSEQYQPQTAKKELSALEAELASLRAKVEQQASMIEILERKAREDKLTGLLNRRGFEAALADALDYYHRYQRCGALLLIDLNDFKTVNDTLGHAAGDAILQHVAQLLLRHTRASDSVARLGGDEFCVILREAGPAEARLKKAELETVLGAMPCTYAGHEIYTSASIGACTFTEAPKEQDILELADANMYRRKASSRRNDRAS